jgi:hypothetical protein
VFERPLEIPAYTELELDPGAALECAVAGAPRGILLGNGATLRSTGGGAESARVIARASCQVESLISNASHDGSQEFAYVEGVFVTAETGATVSISLVHFVSLFVNSGIRDCVLASNRVARSGLRIEGGAKTGFGPVYVENVWVNHSREHNIVITEHDPHRGSATCWLTNVTSEHQGGGFHGLYLRGYGGLFNVVVRNYHYEHGQPVAAPTAAIYVDGVPGFTADNVDILSAPIENKQGIVVTNNFRNVRTHVRGIQNINGVSPILDDQLLGVKLGNRHVNFYDSSDPAYSEQVFANLVKMPGGVALKTKAGAITDADFGARNAVPDGTLAVDTENARLYVRVGGTWRFVSLSR